MHRSLWISLCLVAGCSSPTPEPRFPTPVNATNHTWFPITAGTRHEFGKTLAVDGPVTCDSCHRPTADSFTKVKCDQCHKHTEALTQRLHLGVTDFAIDPGTETNPDVLAELRGAGCYRCHPAGEPVAFSHTGITGECSQCHAENNAFAALPKPGFTHRDIGASDCGNCHHDVTNWAVADAVATASDPAQNVDLTALMPTFTATTITRVTPLAQSLPMPMNHGALALDAGVLTDCAACHSEANAGVYYPGLMHSSLAGIGEAQPQRCSECHTASQPQGFVGVVATAPARTPPTGEMRHDAVGWTNGAPTTTKLVTQDCATCHRTPDAVFATTWGVVSEDGGRPRFHAPLTAAGQAQPTSCLDCHANTRPTVPLTSMNAAVVAGMTFDHGAGNALDDCAGCHASSTTRARRRRRAACRVTSRSGRPPPPAGRAPRTPALPSTTAPTRRASRTAAAKTARSVTRARRRPGWAATSRTAWARWRRRRASPVTPRSARRWWCRASTTRSTAPVTAAPATRPRCAPAATSTTSTRRRTCCPAATGRTAPRTPATWW
jgi:hypothetical protein